MPSATTPARSRIPSAASPSRSRDAWLAYLRLLRRYHQYEVEGLDYLPTDRAALIVGYHGRPIAYDLCMLSGVLYDRLGYLPHGLAHEAFFRSRRLGAIARGLSLVPFDEDSIRAIVARGEHVIVAPGGTREGCRSFRSRYRVDWGRRMGYLRLAIAQGLPIVPAAASGVDDVFIGLNDGYRWGKRLRMPARLPVWVGIGATGLWPLSLPFPAKIRQFLGPAIDPTRRGTIDPRDESAMSALHAEVMTAVQTLLSRATRNREG